MLFLPQPHPWPLPGSKRFGARIGFGAMHWLLEVSLVPLWEATELEMCLERNANQCLGLAGCTAMRLVNKGAVPGCTHFPSTPSLLNHCSILDDCFSQKWPHLTWLPISEGIAAEGEQMTSPWSEDCKGRVRINRCVTATPFPLGLSTVPPSSSAGLGCSFP